MMHVGDILCTVGCSVPWGYHQYCGGYHDAVGDIMSTVGDIMSSVEVFSTVGDTTIHVGIS